MFLYTYILYVPFIWMLSIQQDKYIMDPGELNILQQLCQSINDIWTKNGVFPPPGPQFFFRKIQPCDSLPNMNSKHHAKFQKNPLICFRDTIKSISPGFIDILKHFLGGLHSGGLIFGGHFVLVSE